MSIVPCPLLMAQQPLSTRPKKILLSDASPVLYYYTMSTHVWHNYTLIIPKKEKRKKETHGELATLKGPTNAMFFVEHLD